MPVPFLCKYQPRRFKDFVIGEEYTQILRILVEMDNLNILLIGNSGSGKTSLLEATIREYYDMDTIPAHNVLRINNLAEQGISYYRTEVKTFCQTASYIPKKRKFVILDDIDMINDQSQQVFRNCIDKHSHKVHFIASCSNTQRVIESLQSRCTIVKIKPVGAPLLHQLLHKIREIEAIQITPRAAEFIINASNNSIRLFVNYMEKFNLLGQVVTLDKARETCINISFLDFENYTKAWLRDKDPVGARAIMQTILDRGYSVLDILDSYFTFIKITDLLTETSKYRLIRLICTYISLFHTLHEDPIELTLFTGDLMETVPA